MSTVATQAELAAVPTAFQRTLNRSRYPMPSIDNAARELAAAYRERSQWWIALAAAYVPCAAAADVEEEWQAFIVAGKNALARSEYWVQAAESEGMS